uniref:V-set and immunoglobulin domain containing 10 n=1 Tax=Sphenodon punctatus TaxID=8508 RepID=A0A8D0G5S5_SPHPU
MRMAGRAAARRFLLALCFWMVLPCWHAAGMEEVIVGEAGGSVALVCRNMSGRVDKVDWFHGDPGTVPLLFSSEVTLPSDVRFSLVGNSSLHITGLRLQDEGNYTCKEVLNQTDHEHRVQLLVASGPSSMSVSISPTTALPNGTLYLEKSTMVNFTCISDSHPAPILEWTFQPSSDHPEKFTEVNSSSNYFVLYHASPGFQGNYSCSAKNPLSGYTQTETRELLVYYPPRSPPRCWAETSQKGAMLQLFCSWPGGYPHPTLQWIHQERGPGNLNWVINATGTADTSVEMLNASHLLHGKLFTCVGSHIIKHEEAEQKCSVRLEGPSLVAEPMKTCFIGGNVTLTCQVMEGNPPAKITWLRSISLLEVIIHSGGRYLIRQDDNISTLTIWNCSQGEDEGYYVCKAENSVGLREVYVNLTTIKPVNIAGMVGAIVVLLLLGILVISGIVLNYNPHFCRKANQFRNPDSCDVLVLMDSEEEEEASNCSVHQVLALVNGHNAHAAYGCQATEGDGELSLEETEKEERPVV